MAKYVDVEKIPWASISPRTFEEATGIERARQLVLAQPGAVDIKDVRHCIDCGKWKYSNLERRHYCGYYREGEFSWREAEDYCSFSIEKENV